MGKSHVYIKGLAAIVWHHISELSDILTSVCQYCTGLTGRGNINIQYIKKTSSPFDCYKFSRLVASPHQNTPIGAITQLLQGGVAIHHLSKWFHQLFNVL